MYIQKLSKINNFEEIFTQAKQIISNMGWDAGGNQISLKHRPNAENIFLDGVGSLFNRETKRFLAHEADFTEWSIDSESAIATAIQQLEKDFSFKAGRARLMRLLPKTGLSVHSDNEVRYHMVLHTNPKSYFCWNTNNHDDSLNIKAFCYHMPKDEHWYYADTRITHWVYNGGEAERIHLVVCGR